MAKYDSRRYGELSREKADTQALRDAWATADRMTAELPEGTEWRWVPKTTVFIDESILPRDGGVDPALVREYASVWHDLPPIRVQRSTYRLIDGAHRYNAAFENAAGTDHVKILEEDIDDEDMILQAYDANIRHGRPLTLKERQKYVRILIDRFPNSPISELARRANVDSMTVDRIRESAGATPDVVTYQRTDGTPVTRKARSTRATKPVSTARPEPVRSAPIESFEPAALTGLRSFIGIRNVALWAQTNAQFVDEMLEMLDQAERLIRELRDIREGVPV